MICKVKKTIEKYALLNNVKTVAVGVSGGADSMCLLSILSSLNEEYDIILKAVHINHNLRGEEAKRDEDFVKDYCNKNGISITVFSENVSELAEQSGIGEEECGRIVRYRDFAELGCDAVATAHSLSDSIETLLFNLSRGTALKGLCGIPAKREPNIIRPLVECSRSEIEEYCALNNVPYITDSTNLTDDYMRNHIRHNLIPDIARINERYESNIARCISSLIEDDDYLQSESAKLLIKCKTDNGYLCSELIDAHPALRKRVLALILKDAMSKSVETKHIELFNEAVLKNQGKIEINKHLYICVNDGIINICYPKKSADRWKSEFADGKAVTPYGNYYLCCSDIVSENAVDADKLSDDLFLSSRMEGDSFTLKKRGITKSLKKLFNELKIPADKRNTVAVLHNGESVVWIEGVGVNAPYIPDENTGDIIIIKKEEG